MNTPKPDDIKKTFTEQELRDLLNKIYDDAWMNGLLKIYGRRKGYVEDVLPLILKDNFDTKI